MKINIFLKGQINILENRDSLCRILDFLLNLVERCLSHWVRHFALETALGVDAGSSFFLCLKFKQTKFKHFLKTRQGFKPASNKLLLGLVDLLFVNVFSNSRLARV